VFVGVWLSGACHQGDAAESLSVYVKVRLLPDKHLKAKTKVVRHNVNPVFDETFTFVGIDAARLQVSALLYGSLLYYLQRMFDNNTKLSSLVCVA